MTKKQIACMDSDAYDSSERDEDYADDDYSVSL